MSKRTGRIIKWRGDGPFPPIPNINYASFLLKDIEKYGENIALVDGKSGDSYTYGDLRRIIPRMRNGLAASGVRPGDSVILITGNHVDMPPAFLSIMLLGATCVPINPASSREEIKHIISVSGAKWAMAHTRAASKMEDSFEGHGGRGALRQMWIIGEGGKSSSSPSSSSSSSSSKRPSLRDLMHSNSPQPMQMKDIFDAATTVALMPFSSGTTGLPKGVMLSHRNLITTQIQRRFLSSQQQSPKINLHQSVLVVLPMYHMMAFNMAATTFFSGGKAVILPKFVPQDFFEVIERHKITFLPLVPYIMRSLVESPLMGKYDLSSVLLSVTGSEPVSDKTLQSMMEKSRKMTLQGYGLTESSGIGTANPPGGPSAANCVGRFQPFFQAKVIDLETGEMLGECQDGELCVRGPSVMLGYANNPKATAEVIDPEGWLHTGDLAHFDHEDFVFITGRKKDLIKVKGYQVAPAELEGIIREVEGVGEVAVAGVPNERLGEAPRAWVVPSGEASGIDLEAIVKHVAGRVAPYKQLAGGIEVVKALPKNHIGKVMRRQLRKSFEATRSKL